jgi:hypothetical protein
MAGADRQPARPRLRVVTPRTSRADSNRARLGLGVSNDRRIREVVEWQRMHRRDPYTNISDDPNHPLFYDPFSDREFDNA